MTDVNKDLVGELRALLDKATPGPWRTANGTGSASVKSDGAGCAIYIQVDRERVGVLKETVDRWKADAALIAALRNAAPDLLYIVEEVAGLAEPEWRCPFCDAIRATSPNKEDHSESCALVLARKLTGGAR